MNTSSRFVVATHILAILGGKKMYFKDFKGMKSEELAEKKGLRKIYVVPSMDDMGPVCFYIKNGFRFEGLMKDYEKDNEECVMLGKHL